MNVKDDLVLIQFKMVASQSFKLLNCCSFVNMPASKSIDVNFRMMTEIIQKLKEK